MVEEIEKRDETWQTVRMLQEKTHMQERNDKTTTKVIESEDVTQGRNID